MTLDRNERRVLVLILAFIFVVVATDVFMDAQDGVKNAHLLLELAMASGAGIGLILLLRESFFKSHQLEASRTLLLRKDHEIEKWRMESEKHVQGLGAAIDAQLARWNLTRAEKDVALLLIKGLSLKEIANLRQTGEKTVRAQCVSIYAKSGLSGRTELAAYFLEDLLGPREFHEASPL